MPLIDKDVPGPRREFPGYGRHAPKVVWPNDAKLVVSLCINQEEGSEYSIAAGDGRNEGLAEIPYVMPPEYRDLAAESVYEYGSRAGVFRLMRLFDEYAIDTTWFATAAANHVVSIAYSSKSRISRKTPARLPYSYTDSAARSRYSGGIT